MPTFPATAAGQARRARYLATRRAQYRRGRRLGLSARLAGHLHSEKKAELTLPNVSEQRPVIPVRNFEHKPGWEWYTTRNTDTEYIKARVQVRSVQTGQKKEINWTFTSRNAGNLSRRRILEAVEQTLTRRAANYGADTMEVEGITFVEEIRYKARYGGRGYQP